MSLFRPQLELVQMVSQAGNGCGLGLRFGFWVFKRWLWVVILSLRAPLRFQSHLCADGLINDGRSSFMVHETVNRALISNPFVRTEIGLLLFYFYKDFSSLLPPFIYFF